MSAEVGMFVAEMVVADPEGQVDAEALRMAWVAWCSDRMLRPGAGTGLGKAVVAAGGRRRLKPTRWEGVSLLPMADSGYRVPWARGAGQPEVDPMPALIALAPMVRDSRSLDVAWLRLTGSSGAVLCRWCGVVTRRVEEGLHVACE